MPEPKRHVVRLTDEATGIEITGELLVGRGDCEIVGVASGIDIDNYYSIRPRELRGASTEWGAVWMDRIYKFEPTVYGNDKLPASVRLKAIGLYAGDFDPREASIEWAYVVLDQIEQISMKELVDRSMTGLILQHRYDVTGHSETLLETDDVHITLQYAPIVSSTVEYEQRLTIVYKKAVDLTFVRTQFRSVLALISVLTGGFLQPRILRVGTGRKSAREWIYASDERPALHSSEWLCDRKDFVDCMRRMLPGWLQRAGDEKRLLPVLAFLGAKDDRTIEQRFLTYCQSFEVLTRARQPKSARDAEFESKVVKPIMQFVDGLGDAIDDDLRQRLRGGILGVNRRSLRDVILNAFGSGVTWKPAFGEGEETEFAKGVATRRNRLSHGDPGGGIYSQQDADELRSQTRYLFLHGLTEILLLTGIDEREAHAFVAAARSWR